MRAATRHLIDTTYFGVEEGELYTAREPIPGYRLEHVTPAGKIGYYGQDGFTPLAGCALHRPALTGITRFLLPPVSALHNALCSCGHRIVRSLPELARFVHVTAESHGWHSLFTAVPTVAIVECLIPAGAGVAAPYLAQSARLGAPRDQPGTLRTDQLELGKTVWLPRQGTRADQRAMAKIIRERYPDVRVRQPETDPLAFINSLAPVGEPGNHGAAGVLFTTGPAQDPLYLLRNDGKAWGIPTAERLAGEAALSAATRASDEAGLELAASPIAGAAPGDRLTVFLAAWMTRRRREGWNGSPGKNFGSSL